MSTSRERLVSTTPLPAGWRAVYSFDAGHVDLASPELADHELFTLLPVAALATVERWEAPQFDREPSGGVWDEDVDQVVRPLVVVEGKYLDWWTDNDFIALLGPGEELEAWIRESAIIRIKGERARVARQQATA